MDIKSPQGMSYSKASGIRNRSLKGLILDHLEHGDSLGDAITKTISSRTEAQLVGIKQAFDPLNIARKLTGNLGAYLFGRATGRSRKDIQFFTGRRYKKTVTEKSGGGRKVGSLDTAQYTTVPEGKLQRFRKGDGAANILARMLNLMKKWHEEDILYRELLLHREEDMHEEKEKWNDDITKAIEKALGKGGGNSLIEKEEESAISKIMKGPIGQLVGKRLAKSKFMAKGLGKIITKGKSITELKSVANFFKSTPKVAETAAATATKAVKPGFLMSAEEKIADRGARIAAESGKVATEGAGKIVSKEAAKEAEKVGAKAVSSTIGKKIPIVGALVGLGFGISRALEGDFTGASLEVASGLLGGSGFGLAGSFGIDAYLAARDLGVVGNKYNKQKASTPNVIPRGTQPAAPNKPGSPTNNTDQPAAPNKPGSKASNSASNTQQGMAAYVPRRASESGAGTAVAATATPAEKTTPAPAASAMPMTQTATPTPPAPNTLSQKATNSIKENVDLQTKNMSTSSFNVINTPKVSNNFVGEQDVNYNTKFNVRESDETFHWLTKQNTRLV